MTTITGTPGRIDKIRIPHSKPKLYLWRWSCPECGQTINTLNANQTGFYANTHYDTHKPKKGGDPLPKHFSNDPGAGESGETYDKLLAAAIKCSKCGQMNVWEAIYCQNCGTKLVIRTARISL